MQLPVIRVAILECDTPLPNTRARYGGYGGVFEQLLRSGAKADGKLDPDLSLKITKWPIEVRPESYPELKDVDAVLLTGSRHDAFTDAPWILKLVEFTKKVLAQDRVRLIGVCFGHQILARAMGMKVGRNPNGWEVAVNDVQLTKRGKQLFELDKLSIHQMHRDIAFEYPPEVEQLGSSSVCSVQGMYIHGRLITIQGHPEFNEEIMTEILDTRHKTGVFDDPAYEKFSKQLPLPHNGLAVGKAFIRFLMD